jgi:hypothetical protein
MPDYFFSGKQYIRVTRGDTGAGSIDPGYPAPISNWGWGSFGENGIDAALYSGSKCYFFSGNQYIRVTRAVIGPGTMDPGYPAPISGWGWGSFGENGIDAALYSGSGCYFFSGNRYIRVTRGETGAGTIDPGYPAPISDWGWGSFGANGIDAALYSGSKCYFFSGNQYVRVSRSNNGPGLLDPGFPASISNWKWGSFGAGGIKGALYSGGPLVAAPAMGLGSNSNYFMTSNCNPMTGVSVTINIDTEIAASNGFGFQLNAYSAKSELDGAQQYVILCDTTTSPAQLLCAVDNWVSKSQQLIADFPSLATLPGQTLPAGYQLSIALANDASGAITGATYTVLDNAGKTLGTTTLILTSLTQFGGGPVTSEDLAPIVAYQLNLVGFDNGQSTTLSSGNGTITFAATSDMTVLNAEPASCVDWSFSTEETANSTYGLLPNAPGTSFTQWFDIGPAAAMLKKQSGVIHRLPKMK